LHLLRAIAGVMLAVTCLPVSASISHAQGTSAPIIVPPSPQGAPPAVPTPQVRSRALPQGPVIKDIIVEGTRRIDPATVHSYMTVKAGDNYSIEEINRSLKKLYATGLFRDVTIDREGPNVVVRVVENPVINRIAFEGNDELDDDALNVEIQLRPRVVFTRTRVQQDVKRILELYRRSGYFAAVVDPKVIQLEQNRVDLVFEINEGEKTGIKQISFIGNKEFSDGQLQDVILTRVSRWYRFLSTADTYDPDRLTFDRELLRRFYLEHGYADFRVISAVAELAPDQSNFFITFTIEEGPRYKFGNIGVESKIKEVNPKALQPHVEAERGDWYSSKRVESDVVKLTNEVGNQGFAFIDVRPIVKRDEKLRLIDITYSVQEGPKVFVERIDIRGNVRTLDSVIRREFRIVEGDAFNDAKLRRSQQRIRNLGYFSKVDVHKKPGSSRDKSIIEVDVEEQSTGELTLGGGYSTSDGPLGEIALRERNLLGRGQNLGISGRVSARTQNYRLSFTEPWFLDRELSAGGDIFRASRDRSDQSGFNEVRTGGTLRLGYRISEQWTHSWRYTLELESLTDIRSDASQFIRSQEGENLKSTLGHTLTYDRRDSIQNPTEGYVVRLSNDFAGLGGDIRYLKSSVKGQYYYPFGKQWVGTLKAETSHVFGIGQDVRALDRFSLGGDSFRGFDSYGISPRDRSTGDALGGLTRASATAELVFPLGLPEEFGVTGAVFTDIGTVFGTDENNTSLIDDVSEPRVTIGLGIGWKSPLGPIRMDFGYPIQKQDFDKTEFFRFSFGTRF
jgi:outer membrane protein insertion porin family